MINKSKYVLGRFQYQTSRPLSCYHTFLWSINMINMSFEWCLAKGCVSHCSLKVYNLEIWLATLLSEHLQNVSIVCLQV